MLASFDFSLVIYRLQIYLTDVDLIHVMNEVNFFLLCLCGVIIMCCYNVGKFCSLSLLALCFTVQIQKNFK